MKRGGRSGERREEERVGRGSKRPRREPRTSTPRGAEEPATSCGLEVEVVRRRGARARELPTGLRVECGPEVQRFGMRRMVFGGDVLYGRECVSPHRLMGGER